MWDQMQTGTLGKGPLTCAKGKAEDGRTEGCVHHVFLHWISPSWPSWMGIGEWKTAAMDLPAPLYLASQRCTCQEA